MSIYYFQFHWFILLPLFHFPWSHFHFPSFAFDLKIQKILKVCLLSKAWRWFHLFSPLNPTEMCINMSWVFGCFGVLHGVVLEGLGTGGVAKVFSQQRQRWPQKRRRCGDVAGELINMAKHLLSAETSCALRHETSNKLNHTKR